MRVRESITILVLTVLLVPLTAVASEPITLVVCAPGYPSNTEEAQPTMDGFAAGVADAAGWRGERISAVYHPTVDGGLESLADGQAALALVPFHFYLEFGERLDLQPRLRVVQSGGSDEVWSLVARKGSVPDATSLNGWKILGLPGYAPDFVRGVALAEWETLPDDVEVAFTSRILSVLRKAAAGEKVAALLDRAQADALASLPFAAELEVVARSRPMVGTLLCRVGDRIGEEELRQLTSALASLDRGAEGKTLLETLRIERFEELPPGALAGETGR